MTETVGSARALSTREFRDCLGYFATGIAVVTATTRSGDRIGATISSFNSVSLEPPLVLFSVARNARAFPAWRSVAHFAVNVLAEHQAETSAKFARALGDKWDGTRWTEASNGAPLLPDALAAFECVRHADYDGGDHVIIVGRVLTVHLRQRADAAPLIFFRSGYRRLDGEDRDQSRFDTQPWFHGW
jgi:flavin reductase (DIM6/NTAB) family NADH-FMN oxidoreductase RutF